MPSSQLFSPMDNKLNNMASEHRAPGRGLHATTSNNYDTKILYVSLK